MVKAYQRYLTARQAAEYLGIAYGTLKNQYRAWIDLGVNPIRYAGKINTGHLRFDRKELDSLMDQWRMVK